MDEAACYIGHYGYSCDSSLIGKYEDSCPPMYALLQCMQDDVDDKQDINIEGENDPPGSSMKEIAFEDVVKGIKKHRGPARRGGFGQGRHRQNKKKTQVTSTTSLSDNTCEIREHDGSSPHAHAGVRGRLDQGEIKTLQRQYQQNSTTTILTITGLSEVQQLYWLPFIIVFVGLVIMITRLINHRFSISQPGSVGKTDFDRNDVPRDVDDPDTIKDQTTPVESSINEYTNDNTTQPIQDNNQEPQSCWKHEIIDDNNINTGAFGIIQRVRLHRSQDNDLLKQSFECNENAVENTIFPLICVAKSSRPRNGNQTIQFDPVREYSPLYLLSQHENSHHYIIRCYGYQHNHLFLEYTPCGTLNTLWSNSLHRDVVIIDRVHLYLHWLYQIAQAIQFIHECGWAHMDIKFDNILVFPNENEHYGGNIMLKLCDFGSAIANPQNPLYSRTMVARTPYFAAEDDVYSTASDIYSFGMVARSLLVGLMTQIPIDGNGFNIREVLESCTVEEVQKRATIEVVIAALCKYSTPNEVDDETFVKPYLLKKQQEYPVN